MQFNLYGLAIALGVGAAIFYMLKVEQEQSLPKDTGIDLALYAVPLAVVVSRLYYVAFTWDRYKDDLISILRIWEGGVAIYGGIIGGALGVWLLSWRKRLPFLALADLVAPGLLIGQAIGRWGNFSMARPMVIWWKTPLCSFSRWRCLRTEPGIWPPFL